jgi:D-alanyl-D-alanine carboxypeptidase
MRPTTRDDITRLMLATAIRLPMPAPHGCVAVAIRGTEHWDGFARTRPFGEPDPKPPRNLIYSLTKTFIATLILKLAEQNKLGLDAKLADYRPNAPFAAQVTIRQLLRHSSGMPDYGPLPEYHEAVPAHPDQPWSEAEFIARTCAKGLAYEPDKGWLYSNIGYLLLKQTIETVTGQSFSEALDAMIAKPHGLSSLSVPTTLSDLNALAPGLSTYLASGGTAVDVRGRYHPGWVAHGVIAATAADVASFYDALFRGVIVAPPSLAEMKKTVRVPDTRPPFHAAGYGLGLMSDPDAPGDPIYGHIGEGPGYHAAAYHFGSTTIAVLINAEIGAEKLAFELGALLREVQARV